MSEASHPADAADEPVADHSDLKAVVINCTLKRSPERSHTEGLARSPVGDHAGHGVDVDEVRAVDHEVPPGVVPRHDRARLRARRLAGAPRAGDGRRHPRAGHADLAGRKSSVCTRVIERLYGNSGELNERGQWAYYGRVGGVSRHRQRGRHQARRHERPLLAAAPGLRDPAAGRRRVDRRGRPGPSLPRRGLRRPGERVHQPQHHLHDVEPDAPGAACSRTPAGIPAHGNQRAAWDAGRRFDFPNPEYR